MQRPQDQDGEQILKIAIAAKQIDVTVKTIYNWVENGYLETVSPGYVRLGDVIRAQKWAEKAKSESARATIKTIFRDRNGRFSIFKTK
jgi:IS30 family transposase